MNWTVARKRTCLNLIGVLMLLVGLGSALLIYKNAASNSYADQSYKDWDGNIYPVTPGDSKMYRHNLEVMGGRMNVMLNDFSRWFSGLWHGKSLALIIGSATLIISLGLFKAAAGAGRQSKSGLPDADN